MAAAARGRRARVIVAVVGGGGNGGELYGRILVRRRIGVLIVHVAGRPAFGDRVIGLLPNPGRIGQEQEVLLPRPRNQLETREMPEFLRLRRELFDFIRKAEG